VLSPQVSVDRLTQVRDTAGLDRLVSYMSLVPVELGAPESPQLFESLLHGRSFQEAPDTTARLCYTCPVAYQMSAIQALEKILHVAITPPIRALRRLFYCAEWIEQHALTVYLLQARFYWATKAHWQWPVTLSCSRSLNRASG